MKTRNISDFKIHLFIFANQNVNTTATSAGTTNSNNPARTNYSDLTPQMRTYYNADLIDLAGPNLVFAQFAKKKPIPQGNGKTIEWRGYVDLPEITDPLTEGVTPDGLSMQQFNIRTTVAQYGAYVTFSDMLLLAGADKNISEANVKLAAQASLLYDKIDRNAVIGGHTVIYAGGRAGRAALTAADTFTVDLVYDAVNELQRKNAPKINGKYVCVLHPDVAKDLMRSQDWKDMNKYARPEKFEEGYIGDIDSCRFYTSTNAKIWGPGATGNESEVAVYACIFLGADAFGTTEISGGGMETIVKQLGSGGTEDPLNQRSTVGWKGTKSSVVLIDDYIVRVECASSRGAKAVTN